MIVAIIAIEEILIIKYLIGKKLVGVKNVNIIIEISGQRLQENKFVPVVEQIMFKNGKGKRLDRLSSGGFIKKFFKKKKPFRHKKIEKNNKDKNYNIIQKNIQIIFWKKCQHRKRHLTKH